MTVKDKLKPCPFCGGREVLKETPHIPKGIDYTRHAQILLAPVGMLKNGQIEKKL